MRIAYRHAGNSDISGEGPDQKPLPGQDASSKQAQGMLPPSLIFFKRAKPTPRPSFPPFVCTHTHRQNHIRGSSLRIGWGRRAKYWVGYYDYLIPAIPALTYACGSVVPDLGTTRIGEDMILEPPSTGRNIIPSGLWAQTLMDNGTFGSDRRPNRPRSALVRELRLLPSLRESFL